MLVQYDEQLLGTETSQRRYTNWVIYLSGLLAYWNDTE